MEHTSKNIQTIAFFFFLLTGAAYLLTSLLAANNNFLPISQKLEETLLLPAVLMGLIYAATSVLDTLASEGKNSRIQMILTTLFFVAIGITVIIAHFAFPLNKL